MGVGGCWLVLVGVGGCWWVLVGVLAKNNCRIFAKNWLSTPTPASSPNSLVGNNYNRNCQNEAKPSEKIEAKRSEKLLFLFRKTKRKGSETVSVSLRFASKRKKYISENGTPYFKYLLLSFKFRLLLFLPSHISLSLGFIPGS